MDESKTYEVLNTLALSDKTRLPQTQAFSREDVVNALQSAFVMIGGVQRLALWAHSHPDKFYLLYTRLLPSATVNIGVSNKVEILHSIQKSILDEHPEQPAADQEQV